MKLTFNVNENVLIPRADTEILVEEALKIYDENFKDKETLILDLCTGSGAIGVSLARYIQNSVVYVSDISKAAIDTAIENANLNGVYRKMIFKYADLFKEYVDDDCNYMGERLSNLEFDIICSNPPYITKDEMLELQEEVKKEPELALYGGKDGLDYYRRIVVQAKDYLKQDGFLLLEIGYKQKDDVIKLLQKDEGYKDVYSLKDLGGNDRVVVARRK